jgi:hypothetical protein
MTTEGWSDVDMAVNLYSQNERLLKFFKEEAPTCANGIERDRIARMMRGMINEFAGYQRQDFGRVIDLLEAWNDVDD